jgi:polyhydroxyalkanoate synthesis regulator phasin
MKITKTQLRSLIREEISSIDKARNKFYKKTKELVKSGALSADVAKELESLMNEAIDAAFRDGARNGFRR